MTMQIESALNVFAALISARQEKCVDVGPGSLDMQLVMGVVQSPAYPPSCGMEGGLDRVDSLASKQVAQERYFLAV